MTNKILLDANVLIKAIEDEKSEERKTIVSLLQDEETAVFITPLIRYEVLRGINWKDNTLYSKGQRFINLLSNLNIDEAISSEAADLFRFERTMREQNQQQSKKIDKHNFDVMHFSTSKVYGLELKSHDKDMEAREQLYQKMKQSRDEVR